MSSTCQNCGAPSRNAFICRVCTAELRKMLADLPWWIDRLSEAAIGHTRLGDGGRRQEPEGLIRYTGDLDGNEKLAADLAAGKFGRSAVLAAGGVNAKAARTLDRVQNTLGTILRDLCESRGVPLQNVRAVRPDFIGPLRNWSIRCPYASGARLVASWLSEHISAIAADESAGQTFAEIKAFIGVEGNDERGEILGVLNRPLSRKYLGKCPTWLDKERRLCKTQLYAPGDAIEFRCPACGVTHNCDRLQLLMMNDLEREKMSLDEILKHNRCIPEDYRVNERTLRRWRKPGKKGEPPKLKPRGYRRPDGREVITRHSDEDEPLYSWADIRKLRGDDTRRVMAG